MRNQCPSLVARPNVGKTNAPFLLPSETVQILNPDSHHWSLLNSVQDPTTLWILHSLGFVILIAFTVGLWTRVTNVLSLLVVLSYVHRGPLITGEFEPVLTMLLCYLCLAPTGRHLSVDAKLGWRDFIEKWSHQSSDATEPSVAATVASFAESGDTARGSAQRLAPRRLQ